MMMDAEMYGMMPRAKIPKRDSAPPENRLNSASMFAGLLVEERRQRRRIDTRHRNERADAEHDERTDQEADTLPQLAQLARRFRHVRRILL